MTTLSLSAQAVLNASLQVMSGSPPPQRHRECLAAVLRELANQVVCGGVGERPSERVIANEILAIANELDSDLPPRE
jgi:hypothetical protein